MRFSPHARGAAVRSVKKTGRYQGSHCGVEFCVYRTDEILLMVSEGNRWRQVQCVNVWDALSEVEALSSAMPAEAEG